MKVIVNGQPREVRQDQPVSDLLRELGLSGQACAVEVNEELVPKKLHDGRSLREGDRVEIVTLIGGG